MARERVANTHNCSEREIAELFKNSKTYLKVGRLIKHYLNEKRDKDGKDIPDALAGFKLIHNQKPSKAASYKAMEDAGDFESLQQKGRWGHDEYVICYSTSDKGEYVVEKENEVYGSKVMYVDRSERLVGNAVGDTKQNRFYTGTADGRLMQQKEFCFCEGGCASGNACKNDDVSGASERNYKAVSKEKSGASYHVKTTEEERIVHYTGKVLYEPDTMKEVHEYEYRFKAKDNTSRELAETRLEEGKLVFTNNSLETKSVRERALVIFVGRMAQKNGARNWDAGIMEGEEGDLIKVKRVTIESKETANRDMGAVVTVKKADVRLTSVSQPVCYIRAVLPQRDVMKKLNENIK